MASHFRFKKLTALVIASLTAPSLSTAATESAVPTLPEVSVESAQDRGYAPVFSSSATKSNAPLRDVPQTVNVITEALIKDQAARSLQDVLRNVPGVGMSNGDGQRDQVTIRGFSAISDQFIDGIRDDSLYFRIPERITILTIPNTELIIVLIKFS